MLIKLKHPLLILSFFVLFMSCLGLKNGETITISKGPCLGTCPEFNVTMSYDGAITFIGKRNTKFTGQTTVNLTQKEKSKLKKSFSAIDFSTLKDSYTKGERDTPRTTITYNNKKIILTQLGATPKNLSDFLATFNTILKDKELL